MIERLIKSRIYCLSLLAMGAAAVYAYVEYKYKHTTATQALYNDLSLQPHAHTSRHSLIRECT